jgi:hypothetical protein
MVALTCFTTSIICAAPGGLYSVADYGAVADGTTDDSTAFQNAIDDADTSGGGIVVIPTGTYKLNSALRVKDNITLQGDGKTNTVLDLTSAGGMVIRLYGDNINLADFTVLSGVGTSGGQGIGYHTSASDFPAGHGAENFHITNVRVEGNRDLLMFFPAETYFYGWVTDSEFVGKVSTTDLTLDLHPKDGAFIYMDNVHVVSKNDGAILWESFAGGTTNNLYFLNSTLDDSGTGASLIESGTANVINVRGSTYDTSKAIGNVVHIETGNPTYTNVTATNNITALETARVGKFSSDFGDDVYMELDIDTSDYTAHIGINDSVGFPEELHLDFLSVVASSISASSVALNNNLTMKGDLIFTAAGGGVPFGEISAYNQSDELTISGSGISNKVQVTTFNSNGVSNLSVPSHGSDHITISRSGVYSVNVSVSLDSVAGSGGTIGIGLFKNNGTTQFQNVHATHDLAGGGGEAASLSLSGLIDVNNTDTIEVWVWNDSNSNNVVVDDITLSLSMIGG